jgi:hypothetical protein
MQPIRPLVLLAFAAVFQSPAFGDGGDAGDYAGNYAATRAAAPAPASAPELPGYQIPHENTLPDTSKLLGAPREVGASEPDDDTTNDASRRKKPVFATTTTPRRHDVFANPWPPAWKSTNSTPAYRNPW